MDRCLLLVLLCLQVSLLITTFTSTEATAEVTESGRELLSDQGRAIERKKAVKYLNGCLDRPGVYSPFRVIPSKVPRKREEGNENPSHEGNNQLRSQDCAEEVENGPSRNAMFHLEVDMHMLCVVPPIIYALVY
ncbi:uncharacterized protein V6R79_004000 [Siganus canaliculatus]